MDKLIIAVATTGAITTKADSPYLPTKPAEIAEEVKAAYEAGASVCHIHVRDDEDRGSMQFERFAETVGLVRECCPNIIVNMTSSGGLACDEGERLYSIGRLRPELASFDAGSMNFGSGVFLNTPVFLETLGSALLEYGVKPEIEIFDAGMIANARRLARGGFLEPPYWFQFVLNVPGGMEGTPKNLLHLVESIPQGSSWSVVGCGPTHLPMATMAVHMGGHVRVGMEDNVFLKKGVLARHNSQFVERIVKIAEIFDRPVASPDEARSIIGLSPIGVSL